jgi:hypothetical protein
MNEKTFKAQIAFMSSIFGHQLTDENYKIYWELFKPYSDADFNQMCTNLLKSFSPTSQVPFPVPAHFLQSIAAAGRNRARMAVNAIINAAGRIGPYRSISFGDRALHATIYRFGGWAEMCNWSQDDWKFQERNFIESYEAQQSLNSGPDHLPGICEYENDQKALSGRQLELANEAKRVAHCEWAGYTDLQIEHKDENDIAGLIDCLCDKMDAKKNLLKIR